MLNDLSPTHSPNPSLAPPGERGGLHVAACSKAGNLCATVRWPQSGANPATIRCSPIRRCIGTPIVVISAHLPEITQCGHSDQALAQRQVARVLPTFRDKAKCGCWLPFPHQRGWKGAGGIGGGIQRIRKESAAQNGGSRPSCINLDEQETRPKTELTIPARLRTATGGAK